MVPSRAVTRPEMIVSTVGVRLGTRAAARLAKLKLSCLVKGNSNGTGIFVSSYTDIKQVFRL